MTVRKISISLDEWSLSVLDEYKEEHGLSRSDTMRAALRALHANKLAAQYMEAAQNMTPEEKAEMLAWDSLAGDGIDHDETW